MIDNILVIYVSISIIAAFFLLVIAAAQGVTYWDYPNWHNAKDFRDAVKRIPFCIIWPFWILWVVFIFFPRLYLKARNAK